MVRPIDATIRKSDRITINRDDRGKGRPKLTWDMGVKNMDLFNLIELIAPL